VIVSCTAARTLAGAEPTNFQLLRLCGAPHNRRNWLFWGSDAGGRTAAVLTSFTATCRLHGIDPWSYLSDVLARIPSYPADRLVELLPGAWAATHRTAR
jgi:hypothetical protein